MVQLALLMMWCLPESYWSSLTPRTMVMSSFLAGALMSTFLAPPLRWPPAALASVKRPVDSMTMSTPRSPQGSSAGSFSERTLISLPSTMSESSVCSTRALVGAVGGVALEEERVHLGRDEVVDGHDLDVGGALDDGLERLAPDAAEAVDADPRCHAWDSLLPGCPASRARAASLPLVGPGQPAPRVATPGPDVMWSRPPSRRPRSHARRWRSGQAGPMRRAAPCR